MTPTNTVPSAPLRQHPLDRISPWNWDISETEWLIFSGLVCVVTWACWAVTAA